MRQSEFLFERRYLTAQLGDSCPDPNLWVALRRLFHQRGQQLADVIVAAKTVGRKRRIAFAQRKHVCAAINQELDHFCVPLHARNVQGSVAKIASFVDIDGSVSESLGSSEIAHLTTQWSALSPSLLVAFTSDKISVGKVRRSVQSCKYPFKLAVHDRNEH
jgi:hypothetical protein